jgi:AraC-like DNA-binding protein
VFRERRGIGPAQLVAALGGVAIKLAFAYELPRRLFGATPLVVLAGRVVPHGIALLFVLLAIVDAQREVRSDLVEPRRRLRVAFVTAIATYAAIVAVVETALQNDPAPAALDLAHVGLLTAAALAGAVLVFKHGDNLLGREACPSPLLETPAVELPRLEVEPPGPAFALVEAGGGTLEQARATPRAPVDPLLEELQAWIARKGFLEPELSVAQLARTLRTQEYKLRRLLNGQLGFRNFNDFLHRHRVQAACERLTYAGAELSIIELSLDVGYRSLATFNRAFKEITGVSPTEYRARHAASKTAKSSPIP